MPGRYDIIVEDSPTQNLLESGEKFLTQHTHETHHVREVSEDVFNTASSAHIFEVSKKAVEARNSVEMPPKQLSQNHAVQDAGLLGIYTPTTSTLSKKRKADEMCTSDSEQPTAPTAAHTANGQAVSTGITALAFPSSITSEIRPIKRLRKVAEAVGYAALGGVAVISALIATAPALE